MTNFQKSLTFNAGIIAIASLASRILGLFRDRVLASQFGAGATLDAYYAAFRIPDLLFNLVILGALSSAFIPVFTEYLARGDKKNAWRLTNSVINLAIAALIIFSAVVYVAAPYLLKAITPGFDADRMRLAVMFTRIMLLSPIFLGISSIVGGVLNSFGRFLMFSLAPIFYNLGIIFGALFLVSWLGPVGLAWGVVIGALLHLLIQLPVMVGLGFRWRPNFETNHPDLIRIFKLMLPVTFGLAISQLSLFVDTIIGSTLSVGSIAAVNFANNLASLPVGFVGISFALSAFPIMARASSAGDEEEFASSFNFTLRQIFYLIIPASIAILVFRAHIVRLVLGAGAFGWQDTIMTYRVLGYFAVGLFAQAAIPLVARAFYALQDSRTPVKISFFSFLINIAGSIIFSRIFGIAGLGMALSLSVIINISLLLWTLSQKVERFSLEKIFIPTLNILLAGIIAGLVGYFSLFSFDLFVDTQTVLGLFIQTLGALAIMALVYLIISLVVGLEEIRVFIPARFRGPAKKIFSQS